MVEFGNLDPASALEWMFRHIERVETESFPFDRSASAMGRILAQPIRLDRDSPACDVSAMDGYAVRIADLISGALPVVGECRIGKAPIGLEPNNALKIYTGSPVPQGADSVVRLELVEASGRQIRLSPECRPERGSDIRRQGENAKRGDLVLDTGICLTPSSLSAIASIGPKSIEVYRRLEITILTTGNELVTDPTSDLASWQLRDSNGPTLAAMLGGNSWVGQVVHKHVVDSLESLTKELQSAIVTSDAVVLTGGVSKGAYDFVAEAVRQSGGEVLFHGVTARPGRPTLGALVGTTPVMGLPGNPLAVLSSGRRLLLPTLRYLAGFETPDPPMPVATLSAWQGKPIPLTWWRPVKLGSKGVATLVSLRGSGDVCGPASSDGFVEVPPNSAELGPHPFYSWLP